MTAILNVTIQYIVLKCDWTLHPLPNTDLELLDYMSDKTPIDVIILE